MSTNKSGWKIIHDEVYESFPIFTLKKSRRVNPMTGKAIDFVRVEGLDWVNVAALTADNQLVLVRQYRHGAEDFTLELPGGCIEKGEDPAASGARELLEETGYSAGELEPLGVLYPNPAMYNMKNYFFLARNVKLTAPQALDGGEDIAVVLKPLDEVFEMVARGELMQGMTVAGLGLMQIKGRR